MAFDHLSDAELIALYNATPKPNQYGKEVLRRIHKRDQIEAMKESETKS